MGTRHNLTAWFVVWLWIIGAVAGFATAAVVYAAIDVDPGWSLIVAVIAGFATASPLIAVGLVIALLASIDEHLHVSRVSPPRARADSRA